MINFKGFEMAAVPQMQIGWGVVERGLAQALLAQTTDRLMLVSSGFIAESLTELLREVFQQRQVHHVVVSGEPTDQRVDELVAQAPEQIELVVAIGGGSVLDAAKAIAGLLPERHSVVDYLEGVGCGRVLQHNPVPFVAVPTTAGTGSETTKNAVISRKGEFKKSFRDARLVAKQVWLDGSFLLSCPPSVLYPTAMDALTQLLESYVTLKANPITDALAWQGLSLFKEAMQLIESKQEDQRQQGYQNLMLAASLSGITLANAGLGAVHGLAGPMGAFYPVPHGLACARLLAPITRINIQALQQALECQAENPEQIRLSLHKYRQVAQLLSGKDELQTLIDYCDGLTHKYMSQGLRDFGVEASGFALILQNCRAGSMLGNPWVLSDAQLSQALHEAL